MRAWALTPTGPEAAEGGVGRTPVARVTNSNGLEGLLSPLSPLALNGLGRSTRTGSEATWGRPRSGHGLLAQTGRKATETRPGKGLRGGANLEEGMDD